MTLLLLGHFALLALINHARFSASDETNNTVITVTKPSSLSACEPITNDIPTCINVGWANTSFPNLRSHKSQAEAYSELQDFNPLISVQCSNKLVHFLCAVYAPVCLYTESGESVILGPCRSLCEYVRSGCEDVLAEAGYSWPLQLNCDNFPTTNGCLDVPDDVSLPVIPGVVEPPRVDASSSMAFSLGITSSPTSTFVPTPTPSPSMPHCQGFLDGGNCVDSCNSQKYTVDDGGNVLTNPDYRIEFGKQCLKSCPEGYLEHMSKCIASCPEGFLGVTGTCQECIGDCEQGLAATAPYPVEITGPFIAWGIPINHIGHILNYEVRVMSITGDAQSIIKDDVSFYHVLVREDIPSNLGGSTSVIVQVRAVTSYGTGEWSEEQLVPVTTLMISNLIPTLIDPEPKISFIHNTPIITGRTATIHISVNHPFSRLECRLSSNSNVQLGTKGDFHDCSSGVATYEDLPDAVYRFHALAELEAGGRLISTSRKFRPDNAVECSAHLINNGITVSGNTVTVEFAFLGDYTRCKMDDEDFKDCSSPYLLTNLSSGEHFLKITPQICRAPFRYPLKLYFSVQ